MRKKIEIQIRMQCCCLSIQLSEDWKLEAQIYCFPSKDRKNEGNFSENVNFYKYSAASANGGKKKLKKDN